jgi:hypothetical protein
MLPLNRIRYPFVHVEDVIILHSNVTVQRLRPATQTLDHPPSESQIRLEGAAFTCIDLT